MKKIFAFILAVALCLTLCACDVLDTFKESAEKTLNEMTAESAEEKTAETAKPKTEATAKPTASAQPKAEATPKNTAQKENADISPANSTATITVTPKPTQAPTVPTAATPTPVISAAKYAYDPVKVTKSPTSEIVYEGGHASFVAYADNSTGISWLLVNPNGTDYFDATTLAKSMPGLSISGIGTNTLTIGCIPLSLDGWCVQAKFYGEGGPVHSSMARITVWPYPQNGTGDISDSLGDGGWNPFAGY